MRKTLFPVLFFISLITPAAQEGRWDMLPFYTRLEGGTLILPGRPYSEPYGGFSTVYFIDGELAVLFSGEKEHRVFYEMIPGEADNSIFRLTFRTGDKLDIRLVRELETAFLFEYLAAPALFGREDAGEEFPAAGKDQETSSPDVTPVPVTPKPEKPGSASEFPTEVPASESPSLWFFSGKLVKQLN